MGATPTLSGLGEPPKFDLRAYEGATHPRELSTLATAIHTPMWARLSTHWVSGESATITIYVRLAVLVAGSLHAPMWGA